MMVVIVIENATAKLRGELTRWLLEIRPGTFAGNLSALVRQKLWDKVCEEDNKSGALMLHSYNNEQGFLMQISGDPKRKIVDLDGLQLIYVKNKPSYFTGEFNNINESLNEYDIPDEKDLEPDT